MKRALIIAASTALVCACGARHEGERVEVDPMFLSVGSIRAPDGGSIRAMRKGSITQGGQSQCWSEVELHYPAAADLDLLLLRHDCPLWREMRTTIRWDQGVGTLGYEDDWDYTLALEARVGEAVDLPPVPPVSVSPDGSRHAWVTAARHDHPHLPEEVTRVQLLHAPGGEHTVLEVPGTATIHWQEPHTLVVQQSGWIVHLLDG